MDKNKGLVTYKGTDKDMKCRGFQYELGKKVEDDGAIRCGDKGFHSVEAPMDAFTYYSPADENRFFKCEAGGIISKNENEDTKIASSELTLKAEIGILGMIKAQVEYVLKSAKKKVASKEKACAAAQGYSGHAAAQGDWGHAAAQGDRGHAAAQGDWGHAAAQGDWGHAAAQGHSGHAEVHGKDAIAASFGIEGKAKGEIGDWLVLAELEYTDKWHIKTVKTVFVDGDKVKADIWYMLKDGEFIEAEE